MKLLSYETLIQHGIVKSEDTLIHYGIPGQKKGVRRWQYPDGRFNEEGKERYFGKKNKVHKITEEDSTNNKKDIDRMIVVGNNKINDFFENSDPDIQIYKKDIITKKDEKLASFVESQLDEKTFSKLKKGELVRIARIWNDSSMDEYKPFKEIPKYKTKGISEKNWEATWQDFEG